MLAKRFASSAFARNLAGVDLQALAAASCWPAVLLSHADRSRIIPGRRTVPLPPGRGGTGGTLLVDGHWQATWKIVRAGDSATLIVEPFARLTAPQAAEVTEEGARLLGFAAAGAGACDVHLAAPT